MASIRTTILLSGILVYAISANAADIVWVHQSHGLHISSWEEDGWRQFLEGNGHQIVVHDRFDTIEDLTDSNSIDQLKLLDAGDLVIFSRDSNSGDYNNTPDETLVWTAGIQTPMIVMTPYVLRSSRWQMVNGTAIGDARNPMEVVDPGHPFFSGVELDANDEVDIWDPVLLDEDNGDDNQSGYIDLLQDTAAGNGEVLAAESGTGYPWITYWEAGESFYSGSPTFSGGPRVFFGAGSDNDCCSWGGKNINSDGEQILLNIIDFLVPPVGDACDFDLDGACDIEDIDDLLYNGLVSGDGKYDLNGSGGVDLDDVNAWLEDAGNKHIGRSYVHGDANLDSEVNSVDLNFVGVNWLRTDATSWGQGDFDGDGDVDVNNLNSLGVNWLSGVAPAASAVPEPNSIVLSFAGLVVLCVLRRVR